MNKRLKIVLISLTLLVMILPAYSQRKVDKLVIDCFGEIMNYSFSPAVSIDETAPTSELDIVNYCARIDDAAFGEFISQLQAFKARANLDNWLYYQLIRRAADQLAPKSENYTLYTIYKWKLLTLSGFDAILTYADGKILFYVRSSENIYNIPIRQEGEKTYVCLNYHDYGKIDFSTESFRKLDLSANGAEQAFSYKVSSIPNLKNVYKEKELSFTYNHNEYSFKIKLNPDIASFFKNYPSTDYEKHFNIPLSKETYASIIPLLRKNVKGLSPRDGIDFIMHFTRYSFLFEPDTKKYGAEKIYSPEMTLLSESSDCEDRVSLFYYLVKEIYDLPMIIVVYPKHVSIAVHFDKSFGETIEYNGRKFTICEPTPQQDDLRIGQPVPSLTHTKYEIAFAYDPYVKKSRK